MTDLVSTAYLSDEVEQVNLFYFSYFKPESWFICGRDYADLLGPRLFIHELHAPL